MKNKQVPPNPCTNCHKAWVSGRACDCGDFCNDIKAYVKYREMIAAEVEGGMKMEEAIAKINKMMGEVGQDGEPFKNSNKNTF
jgi:hypothetical protein